MLETALSQVLEGLRCGVPAILCVIRIPVISEPVTLVKEQPGSEILYKGQHEQFKLSGRLHSIAVSDHLDRLARSSDPYLRKRLEDELRPVIRSAGRQFTFNLTESELTQYTRKNTTACNLPKPLGNLGELFLLLLSSGLRMRDFATFG